jgi:hypothetical protein
MRRRFLQRLAPPSPSNPGDSLRWVRRASLVSGGFGLLIAAQIALSGGSSVVVAILVAAGLLSASTWVTLVPAIRRADQRGRLTPTETQEAIRRGNRASLVMAIILCLAFTIAGFVLDGGVGGAALLLALGAVIVGLSIWTNKRLRRMD